MTDSNTLLDILREIASTNGLVAVSESNLQELRQAIADEKHEIRAEAFKKGYNLAKQVFKEDD